MQPLIYNKENPLNPHFIVYGKRRGRGQKASGSSNTGLIVAVAIAALAIGFFMFGRR